MKKFIKFFSVFITISLIIVSCDDDTQSSSTSTTYTMTSVEIHQNNDCTGDAQTNICFATDVTDYDAYDGCTGPDYYIYYSQEECAALSLDCTWTPILDIMLDDLFDGVAPSFMVDDNGTCTMTDADGTHDGTWTSTDGAWIFTLEYPGEEFVDADGNGAYNEGEEFTDEDGNGGYDGPETDEITMTESGASLVLDFGGGDYYICMEFIFTSE